MALFKYGRLADTSEAAAGYISIPMDCASLRGSRNARTAAHNKNKRHRKPTPATFKPVTLVIILYTHFVVCAIAHEVKGSRDRFMFWRMRDGPTRVDDAIQRPIITALCVLSYGMIS